MPAVTYYRCCVVRDAMNKLPRSGALWELEVLKEVYGEGRLEDIETFEVETDNILPPDQEMARLEKAFGKDKETRIPFAEIAFGKGSSGVRTLEKTMQGAIRVEEAPKKASKKAAKEDPPGDATEEGGGE